MKHFLLFTSLLLSFAGLYAQQAKDTLTLEQALRSATDNFPLLGKDSLINEKLALELENLDAEWLPSASLAGLATIQSHVVELPFEIPGMDAPEIPHQRVQAGLEINQRILDGGASDTRRELARSKAMVETQDARIKLQEVHASVLELYMTIAILEQQAAVIRNSLLTMLEKREIAKEAREKGIADATGELELSAAILEARQAISQLNWNRTKALKSLRILTGTPVDTAFTFPLPETELPGQAVQLRRPELEMLDLKRTNLDWQSRMEDVSLKPKLTAFASGGVGYPNPYNIFDDKVSPYFMAGVRFSMPLLDHGSGTRRKAMYTRELQMLDREEEQVIRNTRLRLSETETDIEKQQALIRQEEEILAVKDEILSLAALRLDAGVIHVGDYLDAQMDARRSRLRLAAFRTELERAKARYYLENGNLIQQLTEKK